MKIASSKERDRTRQGLIIGGMLLLSLLCLGAMLFGPLLFSFGGIGSFPVALHSILRADYSADAMSFALPAVQLGLIGNALQDQQATGAVDREATIIAELLTPVPTITPQFWLSPTPSLTPQATNTLGPHQPTPTGMPSETERPTQTPTPIHTITPLPTYTDIVPTYIIPTHTRTAPPPNDTDEPTQVPPTQQPPTQQPPTQPPPTEVPPTAIPPTEPPYPPPYP